MINNSIITNFGSINYRKNAFVQEQMHNTYVVNNNANLGFLFSLIVALSSAIFVYGKVLLSLNGNYSETVGVFAQFTADGKSYYVQALFMAYVLVMFVGVALYSISFYLGVRQRKEQFIVFAIRCIQFENDKETYSKIFPCHFCPFHKSGLDVVQGLYKVMCIVIIALLFLVSVITFFLGFCQVNKISLLILSKMLLCKAVFCFTFIISIVTIIWVSWQNIGGYKRRQQDYLSKKLKCPMINGCCDLFRQNT